MKDLLVLPGEILKMDDDETPYMPMWRVMINGRPHRDLIENAERPAAKEIAPLAVSSKSMH
jgi:hypothetical protein